MESLEIGELLGRRSRVGEIRRGSGFGICVLQYSTTVSFNSPEPLCPPIRYGPISIHDQEERFGGDHQGAGMVVISAEFDDSEVVERRTEIRLASRYTVFSYYYNQEEDRMNGRENRYE